MIREFCLKWTGSCQNRSKVPVLEVRIRILEKVLIQM